jgi:hypothetical protein
MSRLFYKLKWKGKPKLKLYVHCVIYNPWLQYLGVSLYAVREQEPGVKLHVIMIVFSPSHEELSAITLACVVMSCGDSCGNSLGCVCIQPSGSISLRYWCCGNWLGKCTVWWVPHCGAMTMHRISFTWGLSGGLIPYKYPAIWNMME